MPLATRPDRGRFKDAPALIPGAPAWPGEITGGLNFLSLEPSTVLRFLDEYERQVRNHETRLWSLVTFSMWHRLYMHESGARN